MFTLVPSDASSPADKTGQATGATRKLRWMGPAAALGSGVLKNFEHVGMTTGDVEACLAFYVGQLGLTLALRKPNASGGEVVFLEVAGAMLEIFAPSGPVVRPARTVPRDEAGIRHLTFAFKDVDATYARLIAAGVPSIEPPRDAFTTELFSRVAFVLDPDGNTVELVAKTAR